VSWEHEDLPESYYQNDFERLLSSANSKLREALRTIAFGKVDMGEPDEVPHPADSEGMKYVVNVAREALGHKPLP